MTTQDLIRAAITGHRRLAFTYRNLPRVVNPMRLGLSPRDSWKLRAVQVGGESESGRYGGSAPKLFDVDLMTDVVVLDAEFRIPRQYQPGDDAFVLIDAEL